MGRLVRELYGGTDIRLRGWAGASVWAVCVYGVSWVSGSGASSSSPSSSDLRDFFAILGLLDKALLESQHEVVVVTGDQRITIVAVYDLPRVYGVISIFIKVLSQFTPRKPAFSHTPKQATSSNKTIQSNIGVSNQVTIINKSQRLGG